MVLDTDEKDVHENLVKIFETCGRTNFKIVVSNSRTPGGSRNLGKQQSSSEWLIFCDCDDMPNFQGIESAVKASSIEDQIIMGSFQIVLQNGDVQKYIMQENFEQCFFSITLQPGIWRWIMRRNSIENLNFHPLSMGEDQLFILQVVSANMNRRVSQEIVYSYNSSVQGSLTSDKSKISDLNSVIKIERTLQIVDPDIKRLRTYFLIKQTITLIKYGNIQIKLATFKNFLLNLRGTAFSDLFHFYMFLIWKQRSG
jgi:hypothetical protein